MPNQVRILNDMVDVDRTEPILKHSFKECQVHFGESFKRTNALCLNGNAHRNQTQKVKAVNCPECLKRLKKQKII